MRDNLVVTKPKRGVLKDKPEAPAQGKQEARYQAILHAIHTNGSAAVEHLSQQLGVTLVTIRRDLDAMERKGLLHRTHGGAVPLQPLFFEPFRRERSFMMQVERMADEKRRIGYAAAALIKPDETICVTPGTTAAAVVRALPLNYNLTVVTSTANVAMELSKRKDVKVFVTGGNLHGEWFSLVGPHAIRSLENISIHKFFLGADGLDFVSGATSFDQDEAELLRAMAACSRMRVAVVDHTKFGNIGNWRICKTDDLHTIVTDDRAKPEDLKPFEASGTQIIKV